MKTKVRANNIQYEFNCDICSKVFFNKSLLQQHKNIHNNMKYKCNLCTYSGKTVKCLSAHVKRLHTEPTIPCQVCGKKFHFQCKLKEHILVHTDVKPHKCKVCGKGFNSTYSLRTHKLIHDNLKPYKCNICDYACRDSSTLRKHKDRHVGKVKRYPCELCHKQFNASLYLRMHMDERHFGVNVHTIPCAICGKMYKSNSTLNIHIRTIHGRQFECKCEVCGAVCDNKSNLRAHMLSHLDIRPYSCSYESCAKKFKCMGDLKKHIIIHYPEQQFTCYCGRRFARKYRFDEHTRQHKGTVQCDMCGNWFNNKSQIALHIAKKHNSRRHICDVCGYQTNNKSLIVLHIKNGHQKSIKVLSCKICRKTFKRHINLKLHYWKCHSIKYKAETIMKHPKLLEETDIKMEDDDLEQIDLFEVEEKEILSGNDKSSKKKSKHEYKNNLDQVETIKNHKLMKNRRNSQRILTKQLNSLLDKATVVNNDENLMEKIKRIKVTVKIDQRAKVNAEKRIQRLLDISTRKKEMQDLEEARRMYNKRIKKAIQNKPNKGPLIKFVNIKHVKSKNIEKNEIIPSVKNLNKIESLKIDRKRRVDRDVTVKKKILVKKGNEWIVEVENVKLKKDNLIAKFDIGDLIKIKINGDDYLSKLKKLSRIAKLKGMKMLFPCENCQKICQTLSALKLHTRKHNPNAKPFKQKTWKHQLNGEETEKKTIHNNRYEKPKPIRNEHKCDSQLKEFYEKNIKGGDVGFSQFLKIYNKISRENITEFSELNERTDFGIHFDEPKEEITKKIITEEIGKKKMENKSPRFSRVVKMSRKQYLKRMEVKNRLRQKNNINA